MLRNYFKIALRNLTRNKVFSIINVAGLSVGLTCCMLIVLYTKDELSFDQFQQHKNELYRIKVTMTGNGETNTIASTNAIHGPTFKAEIPEIADIVRTQSSMFVFKKGENLINEDVLFADNNFFSIFSMPLIAGDAKMVLSDIRSIVISEELAEKYFNTTDAVGKTLQIKIRDAFETFTVSGVARNCPENSSIQFKAVIPFKYQESQGWLSNEWLGFYMNTFVLLHNNASPALVNPKMNEVFVSKSAEEISKIEGFNQKIDFYLQPFLEVHLDGASGDLRNGLGRGSSPVYSYILSGIAIFILLIACINFVNLTVARSLNRAREIGVRKVVGSMRRQLIFQFLGESFLLSFVAFSLAILLTELLLPTFNELGNKQLSLSYLLDASLIFGYLALFVCTGLVSGFYPALVLSGFNPVQSLYSQAKLTRKNYLTKGLVVFQFSISVCLVIGTLIIYSQFKYLTNKDLGYNDKNLLKIQAGRGQEESVVKRIREDLQKLPAVREVAAFNGNYNGTMANAGDKPISFGYIGVDDAFLTTLEVPVLKGRNFSKDFPSDPENSVVVNEAFVKEAGWKEPIGQELDFKWKNKKMTVIGVIHDYHYASLKDTIKPLLMTQDPNYRLGALYARLDGRDIPATMRAIEQIFRKHAKLTPFEYQFEDVANLKHYESEARWKQMITLAAAISIFVSCIGLFGLATFNAETRVKEIGIRKVLGASVASITGLLSFDFLKLVLLAILFAWPVSYYGASKWLTEFPYRIEVGWWYFAAAALLAICIAMLTVGSQSMKAALTNPVKSLRKD